MHNDQRVLKYASVLHSSRSNGPMLIYSQPNHSKIEFDVDSFLHRLYFYLAKYLFVLASLVQWLGFYPSKVEVGVRFTGVANFDQLFLGFFNAHSIVQYRSLSLSTD